MADSERSCSCCLISVALIQLFLYGLQLLVILREIQESSIVRTFYIEGSMSIVFFQLFSAIIGAYASINLFERAWKGSYGHSAKRATRIKATLSVLFGFFFFGCAVMFYIWDWEHFTFHGFFCVLNGFTFLLFFFVLLRRLILTRDFVNDILQTNGMNWIVLTEGNAVDLYALRDCDREMSVYANSSRYGVYHRHAHAFRHSEFYQLQRWIAQMERFVMSSEPKENVAVLIREMKERAKMFNISAKHEERYKHLARIPLIFIPIDEGKDPSDFPEWEDEV